MMKLKCLGNFAQAKYDARDGGRSRGLALRRAVKISRRIRPKKMVGRTKYEA